MFSCECSFYARKIIWRRLKMHFWSWIFYIKFYANMLLCQWCEYTHKDRDCILIFAEKEVWFKLWNEEIEISNSVAKITSYKRMWHKVYTFRISEKIDYPKNIQAIEILWRIKFSNLHWKWTALNYDFSFHNNDWKLHKEITWNYAFVSAKCHCKMKQKTIIVVSLTMIIMQEKFQMSREGKYDNVKQSIQ